LFVAKDYEFKFIIFDINIDSQFDLSRNALMKGTHGSVIIFDFSQPEILTFLEKWIFEIIITCGNVPILLLGVFDQESQQEAITEIVNLLVRDRRNAWNIPINCVMSSRDDFDFDRIIEYLSKEMLVRIENPNLEKLPVEFINNVVSILEENKDVKYITHILEQLFNRNKFETRKIINSLSSDYFVNLIHQQNNLTGLSGLFDTLHLIEDSIVRRIFFDISIEKLLEIIKQEKELYEIILLFNKYIETDSILWEKFLEVLSTDYLISKLSHSWIDVTIEAKWSHTTIMGFVKIVDQSNSQSSEIIKYVSLKEQKRKENETLNDICTILDLIFTTDSAKAIFILENLPVKIKDIANTIITKDKEITVEEKKSIKHSLEKAELARKEAARKELEQGLNELVLLISWLKQIPLESKNQLIESITPEKITNFINEKISLVTFTQFLEILNGFNQNLSSKILTTNIEFLIEKIINEPSINNIQRFLEITNLINSLEMKEIYTRLGIQFFVKKMISFYNELNLEKLDVPLLIGFVESYKNEGEQMALDIFQYLFTDISFSKLTNLYILLSELKNLVIEKSDSDESNATDKIMEIYDFFIKLKLEELNKLIQLFFKSLPISITEFSEAFHQELITEEKENFSYEKNKLFEFIKGIGKDK